MQEEEGDLKSIEKVNPGPSQAELGVIDRYSKGKARRNQDLLTNDLWQKRKDREKWSVLLERY